MKVSCNCKKPVYDVVIVSRYHLLKGGGLEKVVKEQIKALSKGGFKICIVYREKEQYIKRNGSLPNYIDACVIYDKLDGLLGKIADVIYALPIYLKVAKMNAKIVLDNFEFPFLCKLLNRKSHILLVRHGTPNYLDNYSGTRLLFAKIYKIFILKPALILSSRTVNMIIAVSDKVRKELINDYHAPPKKVIVIHNGVDTEKFKPRHKISVRKMLGLPLDEKIILFVGGNLELKGFWTALRVVKAVRRCIPNVLFIVVTAGKYKEKLDQKFNWLKVLADIPHDKMPYLYNAADIFLLPSKYEAGIPLAVLEALASGCPAIVSPNASYMEHDGRGYLIAYEFKDYVKYCIKLLQDEHYREIMSRRARKLAVSMFSVEKQRKGYLKLVTLYLMKYFGKQLSCQF